MGHSDRTRRLPTTAVQDYAAGCSLVQLVRLQGLLQSEVQKQGWNMEHLEASMHVVHAHSSEVLQCSGAESYKNHETQPNLTAEGTAGRGSKGAMHAADLRSMERQRDASRGVPVLVVHVRGRQGMSVSFDLVSGALCMHPGESDLPGQTFCTV